MGSRKRELPETEATEDVLMETVQTEIQTCSVQKILSLENVEAEAMETAENESQSVVHRNHRNRVRERYLLEGLDGFSDVEFLELLLYYVIAQKDTNPIAHELLDTFGTLKNVLEARPEQLMKVKNVGERGAVLISLLHDAFRRYEKCLALETRKISNRDAAQKYCLSLVAGQRNEQFRVVCLDAQCRLLGTRKVADGSLNEVAAYPRVVVETALNYNAHSVILTHNHPGGTPSPSREDIASTLQIQRLLGGLGVILLDHIIVAGITTYSMVQHGDIDFKTRMKEDFDQWPDMSAEESQY